MPAYVETITPELATFIEILQTGYVFTPPPLPVGLYYFNQLNQALIDVQSGTRTAQEALDTVQRNVDRELDKHR